MLSWFTPSLMCNAEETPTREYVDIEALKRAIKEMPPDIAASEVLPKLGLYPIEDYAYSLEGGGGREQYRVQADLRGGGGTVIIYFNYASNIATKIEFIDSETHEITESDELHIVLPQMPNTKTNVANQTMEPTGDTRAGDLEDGKP